MKPFIDLAVIAQRLLPLNINIPHDLDFESARAFISMISQMLLTTNAAAKFTIVPNKDAKRTRSRTGHLFSTDDNDRKLCLNAMLSCAQIRISQTRMGSLNGPGYLLMRSTKQLSPKRAVDCHPCNKDDDHNPQQCYRFPDTTSNSAFRKRPGSHFVKCTTRGPSITKWPQDLLGIIFRQILPHLERTLNVYK